MSARSILNAVPHSTMTTSFTPSAVASLMMRWAMKLRLFRVAGKEAEVDRLEKAQRPVLLRRVEDDRGVDDGMRAREADVQDVRAFLFHGDQSLGRREAQLLLHLLFKVADDLPVAFLELVDALPLFNGRVGEHDQLLGRGAVFDEQVLGHAHDLAGVDAEGAVHHAAPAPGAGPGRLVDLVHDRIGKLRRVSPVGEQNPDSRVYFLYSFRTTSARPTGEYSFFGMP